MNPTTPAPSAGARPDPYAARPARQWWLVICLTILMMLGMIDRQIVSLLVNPIKADLGLTDTQISIVYGAAFAIANMAFTLPAGYMADRMNRKLLVGLAAVVWSAMAICCGLATGYWQLFWARAGVGFGEGVIGPCSMSMLRSSLSPERRGRGFAVFSMNSLAGSALALVLGGALIGLLSHSDMSGVPIIGGLHPWQMVLIFMGLAGLPLSLLMLTVKEPLPASAHSEAAAPDLGHGVGSGGASFAAAAAYIGSRWRIYVPLLAYQTLYGLCSLSFGAWIAAMMGRKFGLSIPQIGATLGVMMLILPASGLWVAGNLLDRASSRRGVLGLCLVGLACTLVYWLTAFTSPLAPTLTVFWVMFAMHMLISGTPVAVGATIMASITPAEVMGKIAAVQLFLYGLVAAAIGPVVVALVSDHLFSGPQSLAYALSLVTCVYGLSAIVMLAAVLAGVRREGRAAR